MLKFGMALSNNEHGLGLVFEPRNLELLAQDRPILINLADVGLSFVRRKHGKGRILIAHTTNPGQFFEEVSQVTGLPIPNPGQTVYATSEIHPETRCWCALLKAPCVCRG